MTNQSLLDIIRRKIETTGPLTIADYMRECLLHPDYGYYQKSPVFGRHGDFITAPEISQMFGELIGLFIGQLWISAGSPASGRLIELGPGRGTNMADMRRAMRAVPGLNEAVQPFFFEASNQLKALQMEKVPTAKHIDKLEDINDGPCYFVANEFFDALPIHQFEKRGDRWQERMVCFDREQLTFGLGPPGPALAAVDPDFLASAGEGDIVETCPQSIAFMDRVCDTIKRLGGAAIIIDYGYAVPAFGDTFQAVKKHRFVEPLKEPGACDLTTHVNFSALAKVATDHALKVSSPMTQRDFLLDLGIEARADALSKGKSPELQEKIRTEKDRLTDTTAMGSLFKVLIVESQGN